MCVGVRACACVRVCACVCARGRAYVCVRACVQCVCLCVSVCVCVLIYSLAPPPMTTLAIPLSCVSQAVGGIKSDNLNELRSLKMPPEAIRDVLEGVLRLMGNFDTSWISMKRFLGNKSVKVRLVLYRDKETQP